MDNALIKKIAQSSKHSEDTVEIILSHLLAHVFGDSLLSMNKHKAAPINTMNTAIRSRGHSLMSVHEMEEL